MNPTTNRRGPQLTIPELQAAAAEMRAMDIVSIFAAGSGHPGGTLSVMDIAAALYLNVLNHDPANPAWPERDRVFWSAGHKAPALYVALGKAGYFPLDDVVLLRQLGSGFEGHPNWLKVPGVEISSGSLGQGLGAAVGSALAAKLRGAAHRVYVIMGDGEQQEGSVWEAAMAAAHHNLDNLCAIIDVNRLQIDGWVKDVMNVEPLAEKYTAFGWNFISIDGHNFAQILEAFSRASQTAGRPTVILARTIKGKGVSFMENEASWHGTPPKKEQFEKALPELLTPDFPRTRVETLLKRAAANAAEVAHKAKDGIPKFVLEYWWNARDSMKVDMDPTRMGFGRGLERAGEDPRVVTLHADISGSIRITDFESKHPERNNRVFSVGIAEQNMMSVAAGLAREGFIPVTGTYGVFASGRAWDQIRTTICYSNLNVKIAGAHGGISVGADGATHQALEEIALTSILPNMHVVVPCDSVETQKATEYSLLKLQGPCYLRFAREATPIVTKPDTPYEFGVANVIRYRGVQPKFLDAFETFLGPCLQERTRKRHHHCLRPHGSRSDARRLAPERGVRHRNARRERSYRQAAGYPHPGARSGRNPRRGHRGRTSGRRLRQYRGRSHSPAAQGFSTPAATRHGRCCRSLRHFRQSLGTRPALWTHRGTSRQACPRSSRQETDSIARSLRPNCLHRGLGSSLCPLRRQNLTR